ncbi:MAG: DUF1566 domain-containing protein [Proteobacteria bacterium]|nr:DUF1566 domain-containing protein [Pseudomonadota bacterium]
MHRSALLRRLLLRTFTLQLLLMLVFSGLALSAANRFTDNGNGTVTDNKTGLMWAVSDNGADIDFEDGDRYCRSFTAGGFSDWRLPDIEELKALYDPKAKTADGFGITGKIQLSSCCPWSSYDSTGVSSLLDFRTGKEIWSFKGDKELLRALPVRGGENN